MLAKTVVYAFKFIDMSNRELIDVLDSSGNKTGEKTTLDDACNRGLWHNSVHAIIVTQDHKVIAQKRSHSIVMNPDLIELSAGGAVNSGEQCEQAIIREVKEELGIAVDSDEIIFIGTNKYNKRFTKLHKTSNTFLHTYVIKLKKPIYRTHLQASETAKLYLLSIKKAKRLVRYHRIVRLGRITPFYSYWRFSLLEAEKFIYPTIHFVCRGNTFRSRLAEEYWHKNYQNSTKIKILSSGIEAKERLNGSISYLAKELFRNHNLTNHKSIWTQTTKQNIDASTVVIFMSQTVFEDAKKLFDLSNTVYLVWNIPDVKKNSCEVKLQVAEAIYQKIVVQIEEFKKSKLYKYITR